MGEEGQSVRGRGWVKFDEDGDATDNGRANTRNHTENEESPGSLEVRSVKLSSP